MEESVQIDSPTVQVNITDNTTESEAEEESSSKQNTAINVTELGAHGDGFTDDSEILKEIFNKDIDQCFDGMNKTYVVSSNIEINNNICIINLDLSENLTPLTFLPV